MLVALASNGISPTLFSAHSGVGSGDPNGVVFAATGFTISSAWDIGAVGSLGPGIDSVDQTVASIDITGAGSFTFITPTRSFNTQNVPVVGFSQGSGADLFNGPFDAALSGWTLASPIGPLVGTASIIQWTGVRRSCLDRSRVQ